MNRISPAGRMTQNRIPGRFARRLWGVLLALALLLPLLPARAGAERVVHHSADPETRKIALTFDDGPHPSYTYRILDILDRYGVKATFFMIGTNVEYYPEVAKEVLRRGHEIGNHTYSHSRLTKMDGSTLTEELMKCEAVMEKTLGHRPTLFRPPEGVVSEAVRSCADCRGYTVVLWSVDTRDWETKETGAIVNHVMREVRPGAIVLMHDYTAHSKTPEALEIVLPKLLAQGYEPVTVSRLIAG